jgi:hypothetical protein
MPMMMNSAGSLLLAGVGLSIALLVIGEILEARRARRPVPVRAVRRPPDHSQSASSAAAIKRVSLD